MGFYSYAENQDTPIDYPVDSGIQIRMKFIHQDKCSTHSPDNPACFNSEKAHRSKGTNFFPARPIEGIIGVIRRLGNEDDIRVFFTLEMMGGCECQKEENERRYHLAIGQFPPSHPTH